MGALSDQADDVVDAPLVGEGKRLLEWWAQADADDRATLRGWVEGGRLSQTDIADRLTATGFPISRSTLHKGLRLLRRSQWAP